MSGSPPATPPSDDVANPRDDVAALRARVAELEQALQESQDLFGKAFNASPVLMAIGQLPEGRLLDVNEAFLRAVGRPKEQLLGFSTFDLGLWQDKAARDEFLARLKRDGQVQDFEAEFLTPTGESRTLLLQARQVQVAGTPCLLSIAIDISERRRREVAEAALARAEASYRSIFENALEGLYQTSPDGRFLRANPALARMFGYDSAEQLIESVNDIGRTIYVDPGRRDAFFQLLGQHDTVTDFESEIYRRDGTRLWISESVRAVRDPEGRLLHLEGVAIDITAQREQAHALAEAKEAADAANRAKSQFLASMSHELRTPLNGILGYTQILARDPSMRPTQQRGIEVIHQSAEHLLGLINDVLDLSKVEAGRLEFHPTACDLPALLSGVAELLGPRANAQGLAFTTGFAPDLPRTVMVDEHRLRQVLLNLLANAVKFTREGSVLFSARALPADRADAARLIFSVSDTGPGIDEQDLPRLFQPFVQVGKPGRHPEGTGLGLAISRSLVAAMGGQLQVESRPGWGSRFWFELILPFGTRATTSPLGPARHIVGFEGASPRLLVVDDHPANREVLLGLLHGVGFDATVVNSGEEALAACSAALPALVLMDLRMPGLSGLDTTRALRERHGQALHVVAVSASAYDIDRQACLDAGCDAFLPKPVQAEALWQCLGQLLPITWRYADAPTPLTTAPPFDIEAPPPPDEFVRAIHELARSGDVVGLRAQAEALAVQHPKHAEFARAVLELAGNFKLKAIRQLIAPYINTP